MVTMSDVERAFQRRGWSYERTANGNIGTSFDGVPMIIGVPPNGAGAIIGSGIYLARGGSRQAFQAHAGALDTFLANFTARITASVEFQIDRDEDSVIVYTFVPLSGGTQDDAALARGIAFTVATVKVLSPVVEALALGQVTARQAINALDNALAEAERQMRRRSA
jgi:hypothetical protein